MNKTLTAENFQESYYQFGDRQAGISLVYSPERQCYTYNAYCVEITLLQELLAVEYDFLEDALATINSEFGQWELKSYDTKSSGCGDCVAKKSC
jgi:hypothetical protein